MRKIRVLFVLSAVLMLLFSVASPVMADPSDTVRVWVSYREGGKSEVFKALSSSSTKIHYDFPELGAYVVSLPAAALNGILNNPWVIDVEEDAERYPISAMEGVVTEEALAVVDQLGQTVPYGIDMVQARDVWDVNRDGVVDAGAPTGAARTLCIIDSGYYQDHEDLPNATKGGYSQVDADSTKWSTDGFGHGSHVGGTIAAENNGFGVVGVTPGTVNLYIVKFFADDGNATYASNLVDALTRCRNAGANVVSMSLGGSRSVRTEKTAFANAYAANVLSIAAAGNEGTSALSYPASYDSVMSVAAIDSNKVVADFSQYNSQVEIAAPGVGVLSTLPYIDTNKVTVDSIDYAGGHIDYSARGTASGALVAGGLCDSVGSWTGKIVLCERGVIDFNTKVANVKTGGGVAAIIYNNVPGDFLGTLGDGNTSTIIGISLSQETGQYLVANKLGKTATVFSQVAQPASGYEAWDGTSMATPHVSAVAALVWSWDPTLTNVEIRNALTATAQDLGTAGRDVYYGYGLVQARAALEYLGYGGTTPVTPTPTPTLTPTPTPTPTLTPTPTPDPTLTPPPATDSLHVSDLDGSYTIVRNRWNAIVTITIKDNQGESVSGATVSGVWSDGYTGSASCVTGSNGTCEVSAKNLKLTVPSVTFSVSNVTLSGYTYDASANTDPEGDSNGTVIVYTR